MDSFRDILAKRISPERLAHSLGVAEMAEFLAKQNGVSNEKAYLAGILHDYARELPVDLLKKIAAQIGENDEIQIAYPELLHAPVGAYLLQKELGITDAEVLRAVADHTLGRREMGKLEQILYLADMIEVGRQYPGVEGLRQAAKASLAKGIIAALSQSVIYLVEQGKPIHPRTIEARNYLLMGEKF